ncbi:MAG TPA: sulfatase-like hydrolase/transferase, partial [Thermoanaerobaculia bacterium]|nr:sulfatase-like hydrolase/transferase [Thermoanaerobaculia bacterium]
LKARGYESGAAVSAYVLRANTGIAKSFDFYDDGIQSRANVPVGALQRPGSETSSIAKDWIAARKEKPFFFLLHLFEPHSPYTPPEPFRSAVKLPYDGEIAAADAIVGDFLEALRRDGIYDRAAIILMSDHGEGLSQHGEPEHGVFLYREAIHVPLMVKLPRATRGGETNDAVVGLTDILPTVAEITGAAAPAGVHGASLLRATAKADASRRIYSESLYGRIHLGWAELRSLTGADYHFIQAPRPELYNVRNDPAETHNVLADERRTYASMRDELAKYGSAIEMPASIDPEEAKKLAALGYVGSTAQTQSGPLIDPKDGMPQIAAMTKAMRLVNEGKEAEAVDALRKIVAENPRLSDAWDQLGMSLEALGRYDEAIDAYKKAIEVAPTLAGEFGLRLSSVMLRAGRLDEAAAHARLGEKVNYGTAHLLLARVALQKKEYAQAEQEARLAEQDNHNDLAAKVLRARLYNEQERPREALALAQEVAQAANERKTGPIESLFFVIGDALARMQRNAEAIQAFEKEIELFPHERQPYANLYLVYLIENRQSDAQAALDRMVRANPNRPAMLFAAHTAETVGDARGAAMWRKRAESAR